MRKSVLAALGGVMLLGVSAADATVYTITFDNGTSGTGTISQTAVGNGFSDTFNFTLDAPETFSGTVATQRLRVPSDGPVVSDLNFTSVLLDSTPFQNVTTEEAYEQYRLASTDIGAGAHSITVNYDVTAASSDNAASYSGTFNAGSAGAGAVPEPMTWAMFLVGFGAIGVGQRRRRTTATALLA